MYTLPFVVPSKGMRLAPQLYSLSKTLDLHTVKTLDLHTVKTLDLHTVQHAMQHAEHWIAMICPLTGQQDMKIYTRKLN